MNNLNQFAMNNEIISWITPTIIKSNTIGNKITMDVNYNDGQAVHKNITISRVSDGYLMTDPGRFTRKFSNAEGLRWEFEYPSSLVQELESLPIGKSSEKEYFDAEKAMTYHQEFLSSGLWNTSYNSSGGSNFTPKKKKRKKNKKSNRK